MKYTSGKTINVPTWKLSMKLRPVLMIGPDIVGYDNINKFPKLALADLMNVEIKYDSTVLSDAPATQLQHIDVNLVDDIENVNHTLSIRLSDKINEHSCINKGQGITLGIEIQLFIEDLPMDRIVAELGKYKDYTKGTLLLGENGTLTIPIKTPIYRWLISNDKFILKF